MQVEEVERTVARLEALATQPRGEIESGDESPHSKDWPHSPLHRLGEKGTYMVTAGTLGKEHFFRDAKALDLLEEHLLSKAKAVPLAIGGLGGVFESLPLCRHAIEDAATLNPFLTHLHADTAREVNLQDGKPERKVWFNFWDTELTYEKSYLARLNYVHQNAVKHGLVPVANQYRWCSAAWFERTARPAQVKTIYSFKTDRIRVVDDFDVLECGDLSPLCFVPSKTASVGVVPGG